MTSQNADGGNEPVNLIDPQVAACPQPVYNRLREQGRVTRAGLTGGPILSHYKDVLWALRHPEIFSSEMDLQLALGTERPMIPQQIDPPAQTRYRKILDPRFSRKRMHEIEPEVRRQAVSLMDKFAERGGCSYNDEFAVPMPGYAFLTLMGLPHEKLEEFLKLKDGIIRPHMQTQNPDEIAEIRARTGKAIYAFFEEQIDDRKAKPRPDLMTYLVEAEIDGERLSRTEILDICFLFLLAGLDTVTATLGCSMAYLAANPAQRKRLAESPDLIPAAVEELLRWETPVTIVPRVVKRNVTIGDAQLKEGELVMLLLGASNLDGAEFERADDVDLGRTHNRHLAFGGGPHRCLGSHLARMELKVALEEWHRRIPEYSIKAGEVPRYSSGIREVQNLLLVW